MSELEVSSEKYIIGCMLKDYAYTRKMANDMGLESQHFESSTSRTIWEIAEALYCSGTDIDPASVIEGIESQGKHLDAKAASTVVMSSLTIASTVQNLPIHVNTVIEKAIRRNASELLANAASEVQTAESLENSLAVVKHNLAKMRRVNRKTMSTEDRIKQMTHRYKNIRSAGCSGIKSRWPKIQEHTTGYPFGKITVLGARPKMGKSTMALNEGVYTALVERVPTLVFSLEMDQEELLEKAGSDLAEVDNKKLKLGLLGANDIDDFIKRGPEIISKCPLFVEDNPGQTIEQICAKIREYANEKGVRFVIIDYLQIISSSPNARFQSKTYEIAHWTNQIRIVAKETGVAVLLLSQISRPFKGQETTSMGEAPMPNLHDLKDSGAIEQDAYIVMFIGPPTVEPETVPSWMYPGVEPYTVRIAANRGGSTGEVHMMFHKPFNKFLSYTEYQRYKSSLKPNGR